MRAIWLAHQGKAVLGGNPVLHRIPDTGRPGGVGQVLAAVGAVVGAHGERLAFANGTLRRNGELFVRRMEVGPSSLDGHGLDLLPGRVQAEPAQILSRGRPHRHGRVHLRGTGPIVELHVVRPGVVPAVAEFRKQPVAGALRSHSAGGFTGLARGGHDGGHNRSRDGCCGNREKRLFTRSAKHVHVLVLVSCRAPLHRSPISGAPYQRCIRHYELRPPV